MQQLLRVVTLQQDAEDELNEYEHLVDVLVLDQFHQVDTIWLERPRLAVGLRVRVEPVLHLLKHVLVDLLQNFRVLIHARLLLV